MFFVLVLMCKGYLTHSQTEENTDGALLVLGYNLKACCILHRTPIGVVKVGI